MRMVQCNIRARMTAPFNCGSSAVPKHWMPAIAALFTALCALSAGAAGAQDRPLPELLQCMADRAPSGEQRLRLRLTRESDGQAAAPVEMVLDLRPGKPPAARVRATAPADVAGTSYLIHSTPKGRQVLIHLPAQGRTRALTPGQDAPLFGSNIPTGLLMTLLVPSGQQAISAAGSVELHGARRRRLFLTAPPAEPGGRPTLTELLVDPANCELRRVEVGDGAPPGLTVVLDPGAMSGAPDAVMRVESQGEARASVLEVLSREPVKQRSSDRFDPDRFHTAGDLGR